MVLVWLCFAGSSLKLRMSPLRDGDDDDDGGAVSAALVNTGGDGLDGSITRETGQDKGGDATAVGAVWWTEGYVDMSAVQNLSGVVARLCVNGRSARWSRPSW